MINKSKQIDKFGELTVGDWLERASDLVPLRVTALGEDGFLGRFGGSAEIAVSYVALERGEFARANPLGRNIHRDSLDFADAAGDPAFLKEFPGEERDLLQVHVLGETPVVVLDRRLAREVGAAVLAWGEGGALAVPEPRGAPSEEPAPEGEPAGSAANFQSTVDEHGGGLRFEDIEGDPMRLRSGNAGFRGRQRPYLRLGLPEVVAGGSEYFFRDLSPETARKFARVLLRWAETGELADPDEVEGRVDPSERVEVDGLVLEGGALVPAANLSGEGRAALDALGNLLSLAREVGYRLSPLTGNGGLLRAEDRKRLEGAALEVLRTSRDCGRIPRGRKRVRDLVPGDLLRLDGLTHAVVSNELYGHPSPNLREVRIREVEGDLDTVFLKLHPDLELALDTPGRAPERRSTVEVADAVSAELRRVYAELRSILADRATLARAGVLDRLRALLDASWTGDLPPDDAPVALEDLPRFEGFAEGESLALDLRGAGERELSLLKARLEANGWRWVTAEEVRPGWPEIGVAELTLTREGLSFGPRVGSSGARRLRFPPTGDGEFGVSAPAGVEVRFPSTGDGEEVPAREIRPDDRLDLGEDGPVAVDSVSRSDDGRESILRLRDRPGRWRLPGSLPVRRVSVRKEGDR